MSKKTSGRRRVSVNVYPGGKQPTVEPTPKLPHKTEPVDAAERQATKERRVAIERSRRGKRGKR